MSPWPCNYPCRSSPGLGAFRVFLSGPPFLRGVDLSKSIWPTSFGPPSSTESADCEWWHPGSAFTSSISSLASLVTLRMTSRHMSRFRGLQHSDPTWTPWDPTSKPNAVCQLGTTFESRWKSEHDGYKIACYFPSGLGRPDAGRMWMCPVLLSGTTWACRTHLVILARCCTL